MTCRAVSSDGRQAELRREDDCLLVAPLSQCLTTPHLTIQLSLLESVVETTNPLVYLELSASHQYLGRLTVRLWGHLRRAQHFRALCLGTFGPSFVGSKFEYVGNRGRPGEYIVGGSYLTATTSDGGVRGPWLGTRTTRGLMEGLEWGGNFVGEDREGVLQGAGGGHPEYDSLFCVCSRSDPTGKSQCPFGEVVSGMGVVRTAILHDPVSDLTITGCGLLVPNV
ncbi:uncharacterized protein LOC121872018 [Homarus americanus]|uniref:uncharacterized protein LOC121872018 n=1 Tax=Homarus americanus TaxID=6706 RepID=UPI001C439A94|nr:uncharacterized protein LOC121872018 [Homarus americanus]